MTPFWHRVSIFSPALCRLLARHRYGRPLTTAEIVARMSHLNVSPFLVDSLSLETSWDRIEVSLLVAFPAACGIDLTNSRQVRVAEDYLHKSLPASVHLLLFSRARKAKPRFQPFTYLKDSPLWTPLYQPILQKWREALLARAKSLKPPLPEIKPSRTC